MWTRVDGSVPGRPGRPPATWRAGAAGQRPADGSPPSPASARSSGAPVAARFVGAPPPPTSAPSPRAAPTGLVSSDSGTSARKACSSGEPGSTRTGRCTVKSVPSPSSLRTSIVVFIRASSYATDGRDDAGHALAPSRRATAGRSRPLPARTPGGPGRRGLSRALSRTDGSPRASAAGPRASRGIRRNRPPARAPRAPQARGR